MKTICHTVGRIVCVAVLTTALTACSTFTAQNKTREDCNTNRLLLTDLTQMHTAKAMLPTGEICPAGAV